MNEEGDPPEWLFVYGTLRPGGAAAGRVIGDAIRTAPAWLDGHGLWGRTWRHPFAAPATGPGRVVGDAIRVTSGRLGTVLVSLDHYEGVEYMRTVVEVTVGDGLLAAHIWLASPHVALPAGERILTGDWFDR